MKISNWRGTSLEQQLVSEAVSVLGAASSDTTFELAPSTNLCFLLERLLPRILEERYSEWVGEAIDGIFATGAVKVGHLTLRLSGTCILMSDQTFTPFSVELEVALSLDAIARLDISVGEPGGGPLGISGPPCNSSQSTKYQHGVSGRIASGEVEWVYRVRAGALHDAAAS